MDGQSVGPLAWNATATTTRRQIKHERGMRETSTELQPRTWKCRRERGSRTLRQGDVIRNVRLATTDPQKEKAGFWDHSAHLSLDDDLLVLAQKNTL